MKPVLFDSVLTVTHPFDDSDPNFVTFRLSNGRGSEIMHLTADGRMHFAPGYTPDQQAAAFMVAINMATQRAVFPLAPSPCYEVG